ncbi:MAG: peptidoglycan-binding protein [Clostridia bacterium]|nr:peptidoglycan-binding protein [Clostridia bacterium]
MNEKTRYLWKLVAILAVNFALLIVISLTEAQAVRLGDSGERAAQIRRELRERKIIDGEINGVFDMETRKGISDFQLSAGLERSGEADFETLCALGLDSRCSECFSVQTELLARCIMLSGCRTYPEMLGSAAEILRKTRGAKTLGRYISENYPYFFKKTETPSDDAYNAAVQSVKYMQYGVTGLPQ